MKKNLIRNICVTTAFLLCTNTITGSIGSKSIFNNLQSVEASTVTAKPTTSEVLVNGKNIQFDAYNINDNNYFKLRDIAYILSGTSNQFEVTWDNDNKAISLVPSKSYTAIGGELNSGDGKSKTAKLNTSPIYLNNYAISLTAYTINDVNYFKLRDLGDVFGFAVDWDNNSKKVLINTSDTLNAPIQKTEEELITMYQSIFDMYWNFKNTGTETTMMNNIMSYYTNKQFDRNINDLGYEFIDIDGDGVAELFIGDSSNKEQYLMSYYIKDNKIERLGSIEGRYGDTLKSDLTFYNYGSGGAAIYHMGESIFKNGTFSSTEFVEIFEDELQAGEITGIYYVNADNTRRLATSSEIANLNAIKAKPDYVFNFKELYTDATKGNVTSTSNSYTAYEGINVAKLKVNDRVGNFVVDDVLADMSYMSEGYYNICYVDLSGSFISKMTSIYFSEYIGTFMVTIADSPIAINMNANYNAYLEDFTTFSVKQEVLENFFYKSDLEVIKADNSGDMMSDIYYVDVPVNVVELSNRYMANTGGIPNYCVIVPTY